MPSVEEQVEAAAAGTKKNFVIVLVLHVAVIGGLIGSAWVFHKKGDSWGDKQDLAGAVQATMVNSLPLPPKVQPKEDNVLASENPSPAPPPPTPKTEPPPKLTDIPIVRREPEKTPPKVGPKPAPEPPKHPQPPTLTPLATSGDTAPVKMAMTAVENTKDTTDTKAKPVRLIRCVLRALCVETFMVRYLNC